MNAPFRSEPVQPILASACVGISELKKNPAAVIAAAQVQQVAILNRNRPVAYIISPEAWDHVLDLLDDLKIAEIMEERESELVDAVPVKLEEI